MCGIVGLVHADHERPVNPATIRDMCNVIRHRGPDDEGIYTRGAAGLGARRLAIIDLAGGHQPITSADGASTIAFNGEIYNYRALKARLAALGHRFATDCDTETVLNAYEEYGPDAPTRLRGMFAFAIWNHARRELFLARDRFGIKPLYYAVRPWGIAFASELKVFVRCGLTDRTLDPHATDAFLELGYVPAPWTPFADVRKLEPGHSLLWRNGAVETRQYWELPAAQPDVGLHSSEVRGLIDDSVRAHLMSDVPVAAFLSGGIDSSTVVASAAIQSEAPHAFVARYLGSGASYTDETDLARALAHRYGVTLDVVDIRPDIAGTFERIVDALDEPHADDSAIPTWTLAEAVGRQFKVALNGTGGDELFAGYRRHMGVVASEWYGRMPRLARRAMSAAAGFAPVGPDGRGTYRARRFLEGGEGSVADRMLSFVSRLPDHERSALYAAGAMPAAALGAARSVFRKYGAAAGGDPLRQALYIDYKTFLPDDILALADRLSMAHGLELRVPFVDHHVVDRVFPLPRHAKIGWLRSKHLLRRAVRDRLPRAHFSAPKRGFVGPTASWLRHEMREMVQDELSTERIGRLGLFAPDAVQRLIAEHFDGRRDREGILWALLTFSTWHRVFVEPAGSVTEATTAAAVLSSITN
jgi:asparagine synthase (glutamine-hydrolysing)